MARTLTRLTGNGGSMTSSLWDESRSTTFWLRCYQLSHSSSVGTWSSCGRCLAPAHIRSSAAPHWWQFLFWCSKRNVKHLLRDVISHWQWNIWRMWDLRFHYHSGRRNICLSVFLFIFEQCSLHFHMSGVSSKCRQDEFLMCKLSCEIIFCTKLFLCFGYIDLRWANYISCSC